VQHIAGVGNPANFFTKVLSVTEFKKQGAVLMATVDIPGSMSEVMKKRPSKGHGD